LSLSLIVVLVVAAVLVFWIIGAYNRLVAMRNDIAAAWARVQDALSQRGSAVPPLLALLREPMAAEQSALDSWLAAHTEATKAAAALNNKPVHEGHAQAWVAAEATLAATTSRVLALLEQHSALAAQPDVQQHLAAWREGQAKLPFVRQLYNDSAKTYNEAAQLFPTNLVTKGLGLTLAGQI
jgi:LemA protein